MKWVPDRKVLSAGLAGGLAWLIVLLGPRIGLVMTIDTALPLMVLIMGGVAYLVPPSVDDVLKRIDSKIMEAAGLFPAAGAPQSVTIQATGRGGAGAYGGAAGLSQTVNPLGGAGPLRPGE